MPGVYLIPDDARTVMHVNGSDLYYGTARVGPGWTSVGYTAFNRSSFPLASVGPFGTATDTTSADEFVLPPGSPLAFGNVDFSVTVIASISGNNQSFPAVISNYQTGDPNGFAIQSDGSSQVSFLLGSSAVVTDSFVIPASPFVVSVGYMASTQMMYLKANGRALITGPLGSTNPPPTTGSQIGNFIGRSSQNYPWNGQFFEFVASTATPSDTLFTSVYNTIQSNISSCAKVYTWLQPPA